MEPVTRQNFGFVIAYLLPGLTALWGVGEYSPVVRFWLGRVPDETPTIGGFLFASLAAIAAGMIVSTLRWALIDTLHHLTGIGRPKWDFSLLQNNLGAFDLIVEHQYRYYQFHGNGFVAVVFLFGMRRAIDGLAPVESLDIALLIVACILFAGSRDTLRKYYVRGNAIMAARGLANRLANRRAGAALPDSRSRSKDVLKVGSSPQIERVSHDVTTVCRSGPTREVREP